MSPIKVLAVAVISTGMVTAAGIAGYAVVNSSNNSQVSDTVNLLAVDTPTDGLAPAFQPGALPPIMTFDQAQANAASGTTPTSEPMANEAQSTTTKITADKPVVKAQTQVSKTEITSLQARTAVLAQVSGTVTSVNETNHQGYAAYAVSLNLADGSTATAYVDRSSGVVFDWNVVGAPAPAGGGSGAGAGAAAPAAPTTTKPKEKEEDHKSESQKTETHKEDSKTSGTSSRDDDD